MRKRLLDIVVCLTILIIFCAFLPIIYLSIKLFDNGSLFFLQQRIGINGTSFTVVKLRTMKEKSKSNKFHADRRSKIGKLLRGTHIDELPQFINILKGEMSIVGPRPYIPEECEESSKTLTKFSDRHQVRPGATGLAQINYIHKNDTNSASKKLQYDLEYVSECNLVMDLKILLKTIMDIMRMRGI